MKKTLLFSCLGLIVTVHSHAQQWIELHAVEKVDLIAVPRGGEKDGVYALDDLNVTGDVDLTRLVGWRGGRAHFHAMSTMGERPNDAAGTLQGVSNIEVVHHNVRLFEAWVEQRLGEHSTVRVGVYDLNSEFYANAAAGLLMAPAFGVGSELAATGPNGPSIFPSTALALRLEHRLPHGGFVRAAVLNGSAGALGDPGGVDFSFRTGVLAIAEGGVEREGFKLAAGYWRYSQRQDDYNEVDAAGDPLRRVAQGGYVLGEVRLTGGEGKRTLTGFARLGRSDGRTTPFRGGWQAGVLVQRLLPTRPDSALSLGINQGITADGYHTALHSRGRSHAQAETAVELTYSDKVAKWLTVQPDVQMIFDRRGEEGARTVVVTALRMTIAF